MTYKFWIWIVWLADHPSMTARLFICSCFSNPLNHICRICLCFVSSAKINELLFLFFKVKGWRASATCILFCRNKKYLPRGVKWKWRVTFQEQKPEARSQRTEAGSQKPEVRCQGPYTTVIWTIYDRHLCHIRLSFDLYTTVIALYTTVIWPIYDCNCTLYDRHLCHIRL